MAELYVYYHFSDVRSQIIINKVSNNEGWTTDYTNVHIASDRWLLAL